MPARRIRKRMRRVFAAGRRRAKSSASQVERPPLVWTILHPASGAGYRTTQHDSGVLKRKEAHG